MLIPLSSYQFSTANDVSRHQPSANKQPAKAKAVKVKETATAIPCALDIGSAPQPPQNNFSH
jgi:hypothetical protein